MSDDQQPGDDRPATEVTSMSLRAERLRRRFAQAAGAKQADPGLSPARPPRDPELTNRFAAAALAAGIVAVFISGLYLASVAGFVFCLLSRRRFRELAARGKQPWGRRRTVWAFWLSAFGVVQYSYALFVVPLFPR